MEQVEKKGRWLIFQALDLWRGYERKGKGWDGRDRWIPARDSGLRGLWARNLGRKDGNTGLTL